MTPIERAEESLNRRLARLQENLRGDQPEAARKIFVQSLVICVGLGEALTDYIKAIGVFAQERHGALKDSHASLQKQHADLLQSGHELLKRLKANPSDRALRKEIDQAQRAMEEIQNTLRRGANSLQRDLAPSMGVMEEVADAIRRLGETDESVTLKRALKALIAQTQGLFRTQPNLPSRDMIDAAAWEEIALGEIDQASGFNEAFAHAGYQALLALEMMILAVSLSPPSTTEEVTRVAIATASTRLTGIAARFGSN